MQKFPVAFMLAAVAIAAPATRVAADVVFGGGGGVNLSVFNNLVETDTLMVTDFNGAGAADDVDATMTIIDITTFSVGPNVRLNSDAGRLGIGNDLDWSVGSSGAALESWTFSWDTEAVLKEFSFGDVQGDVTGERFTVQSDSWVGANSGNTIFSAAYEFDPTSGAYFFDGGNVNGDISSGALPSFVISPDEQVTISFSASTSPAGQVGRIGGFTWNFLAGAGSGGGAGVPEPSSFALLGMVGAFGWYRRRRRNTTVG